MENPYLKRLFPGPTELSEDVLWKIFMLGVDYRARKKFASIEPTKNQIRNRAYYAKNREAVKARCAKNRQENLAARRQNDREKRAITRELGRLRTQFPSGASVPSTVGKPSSGQSRIASGDSGHRE